MSEPIECECIQCGNLFFRDFVFVDIVFDIYQSICYPCISFNIVQSLVNCIDIDHFDNIDKIKCDLDKLDGIMLWKAFEYYCCYKYGLIPWSLLPVNIKEKLSKRKIFNDCGIDGISYDLKTSLQCKYRDNTNITFTELSTFYALSKGILKCDKLFLDVLNTSKISKLGQQLREIIINKVAKENFINELSRIIYEHNERSEHN